MELSKEEKAQIKAAIGQYPAVQKIWEALDIYMSDPSMELYKESVLTIRHLAIEMSFIRLGQKDKATILTSDDRTFERINMILTNLEKIFGGLDRGKGQGVGGESQTQRLVL